jgi:hypothetical protein
MNKKFCSECNLYLEISKFKKVTTQAMLEKYPDGYYWCCMDCYKQKVWVYQPGTEPNNRQSRRREKKAKRIEQVKYTYGLTEADYLAKIQEQNNVCAICKEKQLNKVLCIDHNHVTGKVRGLLCNSCNIGLGHFRDNSKILHSAIEYLQNYPITESLPEKVDVSIRN